VVPAPINIVHAFVAVQPYKFAPGTAGVRKKMSPVRQVVGNTVPVLTGLVSGAAEKSTSLDWVDKSTWLCPHTRMQKTKAKIVLLMPGR
jgi:hypothetical protein